MDGKESPQNVIDSFRKRQKIMPFLIGGLAVILVVVGIIILVVWFTGGGKISLFASSTPTQTETFTPSPTVPTATPSITMTASSTPTITETPTPSGPQEYTVQENDNCWEIAQKFKVDLGVLLAINNFGGACPIKPGDKILIPAPNQQLPTETPLPTDLVRGTKIQYTVKLGDTLDNIAILFNTTKESIIKDNKLEDPNNLLAGQVLTITYGLAGTHTPTIAPTSTPGTPPATPPTATLAPTSTQAVASLTPAKKP